VDGDEAILGLMCMDVLEHGRWWPIFWGQNYGFVLPEMLTCIPFMYVFGVSVFTAKVPMLLWFASGVFFMHRSLDLFTPPRLKWLLTILVIVAPTWLLWSMRLRGGYLPAFALTQLLIYLAFRFQSWNLQRASLIGLLMGLIFVQQAIWLPGALLVALVSWRRSGRPTKLALLTLLFSLLPFALLLPFRLDEPYHQPQFFVFSAEVFSFNASVMLSYLERGMQGLHLHGWAYRDLVSANVFSIAFLGLKAAVVVTFLVSLRYRPQVNFKLALTLAILSLLGWSLFLGSAAPRYALPLFGYGILLMAMVWKSSRQSWFYGTVLLMIGLSVNTLISSNKIHYEDFTRSEMNGLMATFGEQGVEVVFTENYLLQWQVMFYSEGKIVARSKRYTDRRMDRFDGIDAMYTSYPEKTALVDWTKEQRIQSDWNNDAFFVDFEPKEEVLRELNFELY